MAPNTWIALSFLFIGLLTIAVSIPLLQGKIKRNSFYGVRTPKAYKSDENWFKINHYGAKQLMMWGAVMVALGVVTFFIPLSAPVVALGFGPVVLLSLMVPCIQIFRYSNRL